MIYRESIEWSDIWVDAADEDTTLPRVLLVGDSIARSYYSCVSTHLAGKAVCARVATSKCVCDPVFIRELQLVLDEYRFAVIHLNNGLHGWGYTEENYADGLKKIVDFIMTQHSCSKLILGSSTPLWVAGKPGIPAANIERVRERNRIMLELCRQRKVVFNDLFAAVVEHPEYFADDGVHFIESGQGALGSLVAQAVLNLICRAR